MKGSKNMKGLFIKRLVLFLIRNKLHLKKYERFRFSNQKSKVIYYFDKDMLVKEVNDGYEKREASGVSLNYLLSNEVEIIKI